MNIFNSMPGQYLVTVYMKYTKMKLIAAFISLPSFSLHIKCPYTELFSPNAGKCGKNADQNNTEYGHFLCSV